MTEPKRIFELDVLRGLAVLSVLLFHYTTKYDLSYGYAEPLLFKISHAYGVNLLFMISGFVIFLTIKEKSEPLEFVISRISRIWPAYWAAVLLTFSIITIFPLPGKNISFIDALINLSTFPYLFGVPRVDGVYWALYVEVSFYILMFGLLVSNLLKHIELICVIWLFSELFNTTLKIFFSFNLPADSFLLLEHGHLFIAGIIFFKMMSESKSLFRHIVVACCILAQWYVGGIERTIAMGVFVILFYLVISGRISFIISKPLVFLGTISYCLFLIHQNIGYVIIRYLSSQNIKPIPCIAAATIASLILSALLTFGVEHPASKTLRTFYKRKRAGLHPQ